MAKSRLTTATTVSFVLLGALLMAVGVLVEHVSTGHILWSAVLHDGLLHLGVALIVAVIVARVVDVYLSERQQTERLLERIADLFRRVFNLSSKMPTRTLEGLVGYLLELEWLREHIDVSIDLRPPAAADKGRYIRAETHLEYLLRRVADDPPNVAPTFATSQRLSPEGAPNGYVRSYTIRSVDGTITESDAVVLDQKCDNVDGVRRFRLDLPGREGTETHFSLDMVRYLADAQEDSWDSRVPADKLTLRVRFDPAVINLEAFEYSPGRIPGRLRTERRLAPVSTSNPPPGSDDPRPIYLFVREDLRPFEGIILRAALRPGTGVRDA